jgi:hypothetical protein
MTDLIPHHEPRMIDTTDGWTTWEYRGATLRGKGVTNRLQMPGHPLHGTAMCHHDSWFPIIDFWLDHQALPKPFVWPLPARQG